MRRLIASGIVGSENKAAASWHGWRSAASAYGGGHGAGEKHGEISKLGGISSIGGAAQKQRSVA